MPSRLTLIFDLSALRSFAAALSQLSVAAGLQRQQMSSEGCPFTAFCGSGVAKKAEGF